MPATIIQPNGSIIIRPTGVTRIGTPVVSSSPPITYLLNEDWEDADSDWFFGGTPSAGDPGYSTSGLDLEGSQCLRLTGTDNSYAFKNWGSDVTEIYGKMRYRRGTSLPAAFSQILIFQDSSFNNKSSVTVYNDGDLEINVGGGGFVSIPSAIGANTSYFIWFRMKMGGGGNAEAEIWVNTTDNFSGAQTASVNTGTITGTFGQVLISIGSDPGTSFYDVFQLATSQIG